MAFSDFAYPDVITAFGLTESSADLFANVGPVPAGANLTATLIRNLPLATLIHTEKARSELLVSPVLAELWGRSAGGLSLFSGAEFVADADAGLTGFVDFLLGRGPQLPRPAPPVLVVFEAKRDSIPDGYGQCIAAMVGAARFNSRAGRVPAAVYGAVTTGVNWKFLRLVGTELTFDQPEYTAQQPDRLLGVLTAAAGGRG